jgi:hypothetical protein
VDVHESIQHLRLDRRLLKRRGWLSEEELEKELAALPDVAEKGMALGEDEEEPETETAG